MCCSFLSDTPPPVAYGGCAPCCPWSTAARLDLLGPKETWLRLLLIDAGFPTPITQIPIVESYRTLAVLDMGWPEFGVVVEYDGDHHRSDRRQYVKDHWRLRKLAELGWIVIRVIAEDKPEEVIERVRRALLARGWRPEQATAFVLAG
jgi:Protein of unknown function (DUF559)